MKNNFDSCSAVKLVKDGIQAEIDMSVNSEIITITKELALSMAKCLELAEIQINEERIKHLNNIDQESCSKLGAVEHAIYMIGNVIDSERGDSGKVRAISAVTSSCKKYFN